MQNTMKCQASKSRRSKTLVLALSAGLAVLTLVGVSSAQPADAQPAPNAASTRNNRTDLITAGLTDGRLDLAINKTAVITTKSPIKRIAIGQPDVIKDNVIGPNTVLLTGLKAGATQVIVWDDSDRSQAVDVSVGY